MEKWIKHIKDRKLIAIDPGKAGGIAVFSVDSKELIEAIPMPETPQMILNFFKRYQNNSRCYLEKVGGIPGQGGASSMFNFGKGFGWLEMALISCRIPTTEVTPQKWQKELQLGSKGKKSTTEWKAKLMQRAQQLWPSAERQFNFKYKKDWLAISDALLILEYARLTEKAV
jgi:hypothetical protein